MAFGEYLNRWSTRVLFAVARALGFVAVVAFFMLIVLPLTIIAFVAALFGKPIDRSPEEVANTIQAPLDGKLNDTDLDDFVCCEIRDPALDKVRSHLQDLYFRAGYQLPPYGPLMPEDQKVLEEFVAGVARGSEEEAAKSP